LQRRAEDSEYIIEIKEYNNRQQRIYLKERPEEPNTSFQERGRKGKKEDRERPWLNRT